MNALVRQTTAAILVELGRPLELVELSLPPLATGQVLVEIAYSGVCATQLGEWQGLRGPDPFLPHCLGHEGAGEVIQIGPGVSRCRPGDRVSLSWIKGPGMNVPGTRYSWAGREVNAGGVTTFSRHSIVSENRLFVLPPELPLREAALLGCAIPTGAGAVWNTSQLRPGQSLAVLGVGGIGYCAVMAAAAAGACPLIAVDVEPQRLERARLAGASHVINALEVETLTALKRLVPEGLDVVIESSGRPPMMQLALAAVRSQGGTAVIAGNAPAGDTISLDPRELNQGKRLLGTWGGDNDPARDFPRYARLLMSGQFNVAPLLEREYRLEDINTALEDLRDRHTLRPLINMRSG